MRSRLPLIVLVVGLALAPLQAWRRSGEARIFCRYCDT
jgi:hypothetical protein